MSDLRCEEEEDGQHCFHDTSPTQSVCCWCGDLFASPDEHLDHGEHWPERAEHIIEPTQANPPPHGLYRAYWKEGGSSLVAIGSLPSGRRWVVATNWIAIRGEYDALGHIDRLVPVRAPSHDAGLSVPKNDRAHGSECNALAKTEGSD